MSSFGALSDVFGVASSNLILVDVTSTPVEQSRADALDENGDVAATTYYGNTTKGMNEVSSTYRLISGSLNINSIKLGVLASSPFISRESISVSTSNSEFPQITITGKTFIFTPTAPAGKLNTFTLPSLTISGRKVAQPAFFTRGAACRLTGSSVEASVELVQQDNGVGEPIAHGLSGGQGSFSADFVAITGNPTWTIVTTNNTSFGITQTQAPSISTPQAAYHTGTGTGAFTIIRDNAT